MIYIQSNKKRTLPHHFDAACAFYGALDSGLDVRLTSFDEVKSGKMDSLIRNNLFVGSTEFMNEVFSRINLNNVNLPLNSNRISTILTLKEAKESLKLNGKLFIKPIEKKLFSGLVLDGMEYSCLENLPEETLVYTYPVFKTKIIGEWRFYISRNKIADLRNYSGDFLTHPYYPYVLSIIEENRDTFPSTYTIDIGILSSGENVVIEFNDMWAIGNYGIPNDIYLRLLKERYFDIIK